MTPILLHIYVPSIFGKKPDARMLQNERRYLAVQRRHQQKQESQEELQMEGNVPHQNHNVKDAEYLKYS